MTATEKIISLLVISFPDLMPWQVEEAVGGKQSEFYYNYLAGLFDAKRGKIAARMDGDLVAVSLMCFFLVNETLLKLYLF